MSDPYSTVDVLGQYLASIIPKPGRNEVQFYHLNHEKRGFDETPVTRHELQTDLSIVGVTWLEAQTPGATPSKKAARKRSNLAVSSDESVSMSPSGSKSPKNKGKSQENGSAATRNTEQPIPLLAVALFLGEIWTLSPLNEKIIAKVSIQEPALSITAAAADNKVWVLGKSGAVHEISIHDAEPCRTIHLGKSCPDTSVILKAHSKRAPVKGKATNTPGFWAASALLYLVDTPNTNTNTKPNTSPAHVAQYMRPKADSEGLTRVITSMVCVPGDQPKIVVSRADSNLLQVVDINDEAQPPASMKCKLSEIHLVRLLADHYVVAYTSKGAELFSVEGEIPRKPAARIRGVPRMAVFENLHFNAGLGLTGVWYDGNQARFTHISDEIPQQGTVEVPVAVSLAADSAEPGPRAKMADFTFSDDADAVPIENLAADTLFAELSQLLAAEPVSGNAVVALCAANDDDNNIRHVIRQFAYVDQYAEHVETLFAIISKRVRKSASQKSLLSVWLRWLLLMHGGLIAKQKHLAGDLRALSRDLTEEMALMPKLLALQGRLQLLKSQAELRNAAANGEVPGGNDDDNAEEQERELDALNDTLNNTTNIEELVIYANGENDDFEDAASMPLEVENDMIYENGEADEED